MSPPNAKEAARANFLWHRMSNEERTAVRFGIIPVWVKGLAGLDGIRPERIKELLQALAINDDLKPN